jgi:hypothetical protein
MVIKSREIITKLFEKTEKYSNITQLFGCVSWDYVSHEHNRLLTLEFLAHGKHSCCLSQTLSKFFNCISLERDNHVDCSD